MSVCVLNYLLLRSIDIGINFFWPPYLVERKPSGSAIHKVLVSTSARLLLNASSALQLYPALKAIELIPVLYDRVGWANA